MSRTSICLAMLAMWIGGCSQGPQSSDPLVRMMDGELSPPKRVAAVEEAWAGGPTGEALRSTTKRLVWRRGSARVRIAAIDALMMDEANLDDTRNALNLRLPTETDWDVIEHIGGIASDRGWVSMTSGLVRSLARPVPQPEDAERPEWAALEALHPGRDVRDVAIELFMTPAEEIDLPPTFAQKARDDAWALLGRIDPDGTARADVMERMASQSTASSDPTMSALLEAWDAFGVVPVTSSELSWVRGLLDSSDAEAVRWRDDVRRALAVLSVEQREGLALRHLEPIRWASSSRPEWLESDRATLVSVLGARLDGRKVNKRVDRPGSRWDTESETFEVWAPRLRWGDLLSMLVIDECVRDGGVMGALFLQAEADRADTTTEYGGVLFGDGFEARLYPPRGTQRENDRKYIAPKVLFDESARSLAHYHFHANKEKNWKYAGPGTGDFEYADNHGRNCIVVTSLERGVLAVDYYHRGGVWIDLGEIRR